MNLRKIATASALTLATTMGLTTATAVLPTAAHASSCSVQYGNTVLSGNFHFSARNVSVDWGITAASGSGNKRARLWVWNDVENPPASYGAWVAQGTSGTGTLTGSKASELAGGYGAAQLVLLDSAGNYLDSLFANRSGTCT